MSLNVSSYEFCNRESFGALCCKLGVKYFLCWYRRYVVRTRGKEFSDECSNFFIILYDT